MLSVSILDIKTDEKLKKLDELDFDYIHVSNRNVVFRNDLGDRTVAEYGRERDESDSGHIWRAKRIVCGSTVLSVFVYSFVDNGIDE